MARGLLDYCICSTYAGRMVSRAKNTHTTNRVVRFSDEDWTDLGIRAGLRNRAAVLRALVAWYLRRPGAELPERPPPLKNQTST
jgi:hypothetical protein